MASPSETPKSGLLPMARAFAGSASMRRIAKFSELVTARARDITQHLFARLMPGDSFTSETLTRRIIPAICLTFLAILAIYRAMHLSYVHDEIDEKARNELALVATAIATRLTGEETRLPEVGYRTALQRVLADSLPAGATRKNRTILVADKDGKIAASAPLRPRLEGMPMSTIFGPSQPLTIFGERAGVLKTNMTLQGQTTPQSVFATLHHLNGRMGMVAVFQPEKDIYADWRTDVSTNVTLFVGTAAIILLLMYSFFTQSARAEQADDQHASTRSRIDSALTHGRCGLFDWDLARGRMFWSSSLYELLGHEPKDDILSFAEVRNVIHPDDVDLLDVAEELLSGTSSMMDRQFRMQHADGSWVWVRARGELQHATQESQAHLIGICIDVTEQQELAAQNRVADMRLHDAIETISEAFVLWNNRNELVTCNSKYRALYDLPTRAVLPGTPYRDVMNAVINAPVSAREIHNTDDKSNRSQGGHYEACLDDGRWLQISERRTKDGGFVSVGTDITALKRHEEKLLDRERQLQATVSDLEKSREALQMQARQLVELAEKYAHEKDRAEEANKTKSDFLTNISHELRTPLNAIIGFSDIMTNEMFGPLGEERYSEYSRDIRDSGVNLLNVINDILDMSRIEAGRQSIETETFNASDITHDVARIMSATASEKNISVTCDVRPEDMTVTADRRALKQVLLNLVSNAVKFTPDGGSVRLVARPEENTVRFQIIDTGIGIAKKDIARLAKPFIQVENQFTKTHTGSGLGLAIARSLIELHGSALKIDSKPGAGTTVSFALPMEITQPQKQQRHA